MDAPQRSRRESGFPKKPPRISLRSGYVYELAGVPFRINGRATMVLAPEFFALFKSTRVADLALTPGDPTG